jgi:histidinol-phosphate/aromatic aminotransferase/cobyric acid decarboxylase-like protein
MRPNLLALNLDAPAVAALLHEERPSLVWLCNPNNPTGHYREEYDQWHIVQACQEIGATLVVDEAYWNFLLHAEPFSAAVFMERGRTPDIIVLRSLTKDYALAGLRLGYLVAPPAIVTRIARHLPSWNVSAAAQASGIAALHDQPHLKRTLALLRDEREAFFTALRDAGFTVAPSQTHFCIVDVGDARALRQQLLAHGLLVRDCTSFGLPRHIRVSTRPEWPQLIQALIKETRSAVHESPLPTPELRKGDRGLGQ